MRSFSFLSLLSLLLLLGTISSAWPEQQDGLEVAFGGVVARAEPTATSDKKADDKKEADATSTEEESAPKETASDSSKTDSATDSSKETKTATETGKSKETGTHTGTGATTETATGKSNKSDKTSKTKTKTTSIDARLPAGGISMITPTAGASSYYKIGEFVTFVWNYTSLSVTPSAVNVLATCAKNSATYTLSSNMTVQQTGKVVWDTAKYQANATTPLLTATYTLYVVDIDKDIGDIASAGHLGSQIGYSFGMYSPKPNIPLNEYNCATCNGALSETERQALKFVFGMVFITIASFTWFAGDFGVFST